MHLCGSVQSGGGGGEVSTKSLGDLLMIYGISAETELRTFCEMYALPLRDSLDPKESFSFLLFILFFVETEFLHVTALAILELSL